MIVNLIKEYALSYAESEDWQTVADILNRPSIEKLNTHQWTIGEIQTELGFNITFKIAEILKAASDVNPILSSAFIALSTVGLSLHSDDRQAMIEELASGILTEEEIIKVKELGKKTISLAQNYNLSNITASECQTSWNAYKTEKANSDARQQIKEILYNSAWNQYISPILDGDYQTATVVNLVNGLRSLADELEDE